MTVDPRLAVAFPDAIDLGRRLVARGLRVAVAESCTGGLLGAAITAIPGSSRYFLGGLIAYSDSVKVDLLGVEAELLARLGAVSREVARGMSHGAALRIGADLGLAITGIAGPDPEGTSKPAGLIYVAAWLGRDSEVRELREVGDREENRTAAVRAALRLGIEATL